MLRCDTRRLLIRLRIKAEGSEIIHVPACLTHFIFPCDSNSLQSQFTVTYSENGSRDALSRGSKNLDRFSGHPVCARDVIDGVQGVQAVIYLSSERPSALAPPSVVACADGNMYTRLR